MKKSVKLLSLFAMLAGFSTVAAAEGVFVGGSLDAQASKLKDNDCEPGEDCSLSGGRMGLGLKAGYDFGQFRVYGQYQHNFKAKETQTTTEYYTFNGKQYHSYTDDGEYSWTTNDLSVGADYTPSFTDNFKGLVGGYMGYSKLKYKYNVVHSTNNGQNVKYWNGGFNANGFQYGLRLGGIYNFNQNNELEFGVKAEQVRYKAKEDGESFKFKSNNYGAFVGYNYKF